MPSRIAVFCMPERGHFQLLRPVIAGLVGHGAEVRVFSDRRFELPIREAGATFFDLFDAYPLDRADDASTPFPCRYVSYAAEYAHEVARDVERFGASLVILETFSLVGRVVAGMLGLPWVNLSPGHALDPTLYLRRLESDPRVNISPACLRAVAALRTQGLLADASPFSYVTSTSPFLNLYCEPPTFLDDEIRRVFEPLAFFGSLRSVNDAEPASADAPLAYFRIRRSRKIYVAFGNIVWRYFRAEALACLLALSEFIGSRPELEGLFGVSDAALEPAELRALTRANVQVVANVDQPAVLREADVFVTHHGINSTHEAIARGVPMLSYPFFWDQPDLAAKCQEMGLAVPLGDAPRGRVTEVHIAAALDELTRNADERGDRLLRARDHELEVIAVRDVVLQRILAL